MAGNQIIYTGVLLGALVFYIAYGEWVSWLILLAVLGLPFLSLLVSIPAMTCFHIQPAGPDALDTGSQTELLLLGTCQLPMPPFRGRIRLQKRYTGQTSLYKPGEFLDTRHCGSYTARAEKCRVCDYLGLFCFPVLRKESRTILVRPRPLPVSLPEDALRLVTPLWRPKFGGGFAENHELRLYRPGDHLNQVHWKLTAKTGKLILREPMEPVRGQVLVTMHLRGDAPALDRKFGQLLWLGNYLLERNIRFELTVLTGEGVFSQSITDHQLLTEAIDILLHRPPAEADTQLPTIFAAWQHHVGGDGFDA